MHKTLGTQEWEQSTQWWGKPGYGNEMVRQSVNSTYCVVHTNEKVEEGEGSLSGVLGTKPYRADGLMVRGHLTLDNLLPNRYKTRRIWLISWTILPRTRTIFYIVVLGRTTYFVVSYMEGWRTLTIGLPNSYVGAVLIIYKATPRHSHQILCGTITVR